jgi:parallel beta-helix repeat protein
MPSDTADPLFSSKNDSSRIAMIHQILDSIPEDSLFPRKKIIVPDNFKTIQQAIDNANGFDTVFVRNGTYRENINLMAGIMLIGEDKVKTIIDGGNKGACIEASDSTVIENFTITHGKIGISCLNARPRIERNFIVANKNVGIYARISLPTVRNNVIRGNGLSGIFLESTRSTKTSISNNIISFNSLSGIYCAHRTEILIQNNIFLGNKQGIYGDKESNRTRILHNLFWGCKKSFNIISPAIRSNMFCDPLLIDSTEMFDKILLNPGSPCRHKGTDSTDIGLLPYFSGDNK